MVKLSPFFILPNFVYIIRAILVMYFIYELNYRFCVVILLIIRFLLIYTYIFL